VEMLVTGFVAKIAPREIGIWYSVFGNWYLVVGDQGVKQAFLQACGSALKN
jgi:hypothetical protein